MTDVNAFTKHIGHSYDHGLLRDPREVEYDVFSRVTQMLVAARNSETGADLIRAVYKNNELWTILATALADPANSYPSDLKASLISIALFSLKFGRDYMNDGGDVQVLIDINLCIMKGLRGVVAP